MKSKTPGLNPKTIKKIEDIYAKLPKMECKGLCQLSCGPIGMTQIERRRIVEATGEDPEYNTDIKACNLLGDRGECKQYALRPLICRLYGLTLKMQCPFGCVPERWLTSDEYHELLSELNEVTGNKRQHITADPKTVINFLTVAKLKQRPQTLLGG